VWRSHSQEAQRGETGGHRLTRNGEAMGSFLLGVPERERGPERCHSSGAAVDVCSDAPAGAQRATRAADGGVVYVARALAVSPRAPRLLRSAVRDVTPIIAATTCH
jgi:hypothetical protein